MRQRPCRRWLPLLLAVLVAACAHTEKTNAPEAGPDPDRQARQRAGFDLVPPAPDVRTIQVYLTGDERNLPVVTLGTNETITLAFDLLETAGRPLSVYFYHADRTWRRDLSPAEYLDSFQRDDLLDYQPSQGTDVPYVHYQYQFPNRTIDFRVSGNYIVRVTEQGMEEDVLFERTFFVSEQVAPLDVGLENVLLSGQGYSAVQPVIRFTPPPVLQGNAFNYTACFVRNGRFEAARCTDRPMLAEQPALQFYLPPEAAFETEVVDHFVDLGALRVGGRIERIDRTTSPYRAYLEPDYARFGGTGLDPLLNGQIVVEAVVRGVAAPAVQAEYVETHFAYVPPDELPVSGDVFLSGSFNGWRTTPADRLEWVPERRRYEGAVLLKQGQYEYRYLVAQGRRVRPATTGAAPRLENLYSTFVYYRDLTLNTDRLVAVNHVRAR